MAHSRIEIKSDALLVELLRELMSHFFRLENCVVFSSGDALSSKIVVMALMQTGIPKIGVSKEALEVIDHSVCGGLILPATSDTVVGRLSKNSKLFVWSCDSIILKIAERTLLVFIDESNHKLQFYGKDDVVYLENVSQIYALDLDGHTRIRKPKLDSSIQL